MKLPSQPIKLPKKRKKKKKNIKLQKKHKHVVNEHTLRCPLIPPLIYEEASFP